MSGEIDSQARTETNVRHHARVREIAAMNIIEATARVRLVRADKHSIRPAAELLQFSPGELCDIWFEFLNKHQSGWRGPSEVLSVNAAEGNVSVPIQGRTLNRRISEIREHIPYLVFAGIVRSEDLLVMFHLQHSTESLEHKQIRIYGLTQSAKGWTTTKITQVEPGISIVQAAYFVAIALLNIDSCTTLRMWHGCVSVCPLQGHVASELILWAIGKPEELVYF